ncbi:MAG: sigma-70 family RNA polymerase sigma factor [Fimbriimonadales bacterium]
MLFGNRAKRDDFDRAAREVFPSVFSTALRLTRNREEAEDLTQEAMVRAYEAYDRFDGRNLKAWMLRILTNLYINRYRKQKREPGQESLDAEPGIEPVAATDGNPSAELFDELLGEQVEEALSQLPDEYRVSVLLCDVEGMSYEEIAESLGIPIGTVRSRLARGRAMLRSRLAKYALKEGMISEADVE